MRFECQHCGLCCSDESSFVTLDGNDLQLIIDYLKIDTSQLLKYVNFLRLDGEDIQTSRFELPPLLTRRGYSYITLKKVNGECIFLKNQKCTIYSARPRVCQCYPFTFSLKEGWLCWGLANKSSNCKGLGMGNEVSERSLDRIGTKAISQIQEFKSFVNVWNKLALQGLIDPHPKILLECLITKKYKSNIITRKMNQSSD